MTDHVHYPDIGFLDAVATNFGLLPARWHNAWHAVDFLKTAYPLMNLHANRARVVALLYAAQSNERFAPMERREARDLWILYLNTLPSVPTPMRERICGYEAAWRWRDWCTCTPKPTQEQLDAVTAMLIVGRVEFAELFVVDYCRLRKEQEREHARR